MKEVPFPVEQNGDEKDDDHDHGPDDRDPSTRNIGIEDDPGNRQACRAFFDGDIEEEIFRAL